MCLPPTTPTPTLKQLRKVVPNHCFERSLSTALSYLARDVLLVGVLLLIARRFLSNNLSNPLMIVAWLLYGIVQGTAATGLWVLAHECGHEAFSKSVVVNDAVGFIFHSALLVPYWSWAYTHGVHHARVNHMLDGESHVPHCGSRVRRYNQKLVDALGDEAFALLQVALHLFAGWPAYLLAGSTGAKRRPDNGERFSRSIFKSPNHFNPNSELFPARMRTKAALSTAGVLFVLAALGYWMSVEGICTVLLQYSMPYIVVNCYLVGFTWLQHTHKDVPHLGEDEWDWVKGTLLTLDRPFPAFIDVLTHRIGSTHVAHHLFSKMPWYHAQEATQHLKVALGQHYNYDPTPWYRALYETGKHCHFMEGVEGTQHWQRVVQGKKLQ